MSTTERHAVTGAFGYSGKYIARRLLKAGHRVLTLTNSPGRSHDFGEALEVSSFHFDEPDRLVERLQGVKVLYNTYWVRFNHRTFTHEQAVQNTRTLFKAAEQAGVERVVHVSITNPSEDSPLEYFRGKGQLEQALKASNLSWAILRPAVLFGREDILVNNIAWALRRLPVFGVFGDGHYRLQPIHVDDLAALAVREGTNRENTTVEAIGPETFTYRELVETLAGIIGVRRRIVSVSPGLGYAVGKLAGWVTGDIVITREEIKGLMGDLLYVDAPAAGLTRLTDWAREHADHLGRTYASELSRRKDREKRY